MIKYIYYTINCDAREYSEKMMFAQKCGHEPFGTPNGYNQQRGDSRNYDYPKIVQPMRYKVPKNMPDPDKPKFREWRAENKWWSITDGSYSNGIERLDLISLFNLYKYETTKTNSL